MTPDLHQLNRFLSNQQILQDNHWSCYLFNESANVPVVNRLLTESHNRNDWFQKMRLYLLSCPRKKILHFNNKTASQGQYDAHIHARCLQDDMLGCITCMCTSQRPLESRLHTLRSGQRNVLRIRIPDGEARHLTFPLSIILIWRGQTKPKPGPKNVSGSD